MSAEQPFQIGVEGRRLAWRALGRGPRLVLVNGYGATSEDWDPTFLMALARRFEVICPDNRGLGGSELGDPAAVSVDAIAADLLALLDALELEAPPLAGWSMGGFAVQRLAELHPERVGSLALICSDHGGPAAVLPEPAVWDRLKDHSGTPRDQASRLISLLFPPAPAAEIDRRFGEVVAAARARLDLAALSAQERALDEWERRELPELAVRPPTAVFHGELDVVIPAANAPLLGARWGAELVEILPGAAHAAMAQDPAPIARAIAALAP